MVSKHSGSNEAQELVDELRAKFRGLPAIEKYAVEFVESAMKKGDICAQLRFDQALCPCPGCIGSRNAEAGLQICVTSIGGKQVSESELPAHLSLTSWIPALLRYRFLCFNVH